MAVTIRAKASLMTTVIRVTGMTRMTHDPARRTIMITDDDHHDASHASESQ